MRDKSELGEEEGGKEREKEIEREKDCSLLHTLTINKCIIYISTTTKRFSTIKKYRWYFRKEWLYVLCVNTKYKTGCYLIFILPYINRTLFDLQ